MAKKRQQLRLTKAPSTTVARISLPPHLAEKVRFLTPGSSWRTVRGSHSWDVEVRRFNGLSVLCRPTGRASRGERNSQHDVPVASFLHSYDPR